MTLRHVQGTLFILLQSLTPKTEMLLLSDPWRLVKQLCNTTKLAHLAGRHHVKAASWQQCGFNIIYM
jgi:hypothetical protein